MLLRADSVFLQPLADPVKALVYAETGASVETVLVDGRIVIIDCDVHQGNGTAAILAGLLPTWRACQVTPAIQLKSQ